MHSESKPTLLDKPWFALVIFVTLTVFVIAAWLIIPAWLTKDISELSDKGVYGDSYGSINALFTGLAFSGLVFTILLQLREIRLQRADFLNQLESMNQSREEIEKQNQILSGQVEVQLLDVLSRAIELEAQADTLAAAQWVAGSGQHSNYVKAIRSGAADIRKRTGALQEHIIKA